MNIDLIAAAGIFAFVGLVLALATIPRGPRRDPREGERMAELAARIGQLAETQVTVQNQMNERLQAQERALAQALHERLESVTQRVNTSLEKGHERQHEALQHLRERLVRIDEAQKNIMKLSTQVDGLREIFVDKRARGAFGEIQLKDLVESVLPPSAYQMQAPVGERGRVDCLLKLPNPPGSICIDAKFPLEAYRALREATDDGARKQAQVGFQTAIRKHIHDISTKYLIPGETAESALMFLPSEAVYAELHANFQKLVDESYRSRVFIVSPTTLWALLNTIRAVLQDVRMREQAGAIQREVGKLLDDLARLDDRVDSLDKHFRQAAKDIEQITTSSRKIRSRGDRMVDLELEDEPGAELPATPPKLD